MIKFSKYLNNHNWRATVAAPDKPRESGWHDESPLKNINKKDVIRIGQVGLKKQSTIKRLLNRFYPVDAHYPWADQVIRNLSRHDLSKYSILFTSGPPHSVHYVGERLAHKHHLGWVADFRDHFTLAPEYRPSTPLHHNRNIEFEKRILSKADLVICNTRTNRRELIAEFGLKYSSKIKVIYNGFDRSDICEGEPYLWPDKCRSYVYLGGLRGEKIDSSFFKIIARIRKSHPDLSKEFSIRIVGDTRHKGNSVDELVDAGMVTIHPPVPADSLGSVLHAADGFVAWQRDKPKYKGTVGGKIFDYLAAEKPIFSLGQNGGEIDKLLRHFKAGISVDAGDLRLACDSFLSFDQKVTSGEFKREKSSGDCLERFTRQYQAKQLANAFDAVSERRRGHC